MEPTPPSEEQWKLMDNENPASNETAGMTDVEQLKTELAAVRDELSSTKDELESVKTEFHAYRDAVSKKFSGHEEELAELEARFEEENPHPSDDEDGSADDLLPIERLSRLKDDDDPEDNPFADTTPSVDRAVVLFENFREWSNKTPKGRVVKDGLKKLLNTALDAKLSWKQIYRACQKLEEWSKGRITFTKTSRHGWMLVMDGQTSSVGGG